MFQNRTAWFSDSVGQRCQRYWISEGGRIVSWRTAEYLFSGDAAHPDTLRIFESGDYRRRMVTVFHSLFLCACERRDSSGSVCIGHYVLPPVAVQDELRRVVGRMIWEQDDAEPCGPQLVGEDSGTTTVTPSSCEHLDPETSQTEGTCCEVQELPVNNTATGFIHISELPRYSGDLWEVTPENCCCCSVRQYH